MSDSNAPHPPLLAPGTNLEQEASEAADKLMDVMFEYEGVIREDSFELTMDLDAGTVKVQTYVDYVATGELQVLGAWHKLKQDWTWAFDMPDYPESLTKAARKTQQKLVKQGLESLGTSPVACELRDAYLIAALAWQWNKSDLEMFHDRSDDVLFVLIDNIKIVEAEQ